MCGSVHEQDTEPQIDLDGQATAGQLCHYLCVCVNEKQIMLCVVSLDRRVLCNPFTIHCILTCSLCFKEMFNILGYLLLGHKLDEKITH